MGEKVSKQKSAEVDVLETPIACQAGSTGTKGISCIWCYLVEEGVKKAYSGIQKLRRGGVK